MPLFEFRCDRCEECFEVLVFSSEEEQRVVCPHCGDNRVERLLSCFSARTARGEASACSAASSKFS